MERTDAAWRLIDAEQDGPRGDALPNRAGRSPGGSAGTGVTLTLATLALLGLIGGGLFLVATTPRPSIELPGGAGESSATGDPNGSSMLVDVAGAVRAPGLYRLPAGARVADAIAAAGGFGPAVDATATAGSLNLAAPVHDGDQVVVPERGATAAPGGSAPGSGGGTAVGPVDLNRATQAELETLPGIGPKTAEKIIAAREEAPFTSVDELLGRKIVGSATFAKIRDLVAVR